MPLFVPSTHKELVAFFKANLVCPLPINKGESYHELAHELLWLWRSVMNSYSIDGEDGYLIDDEEEMDFQLTEDDEDELRPLAINLASWIEDARAQFLDECMPLSLLIADRNVYAKHILIRRMSIGQIKQLALKNRVSYLYIHVDGALMNKILLKSSIKFFQEIISERNIRFSIKCDEPVGVTKDGIESNYLMVEIDTSSRVAHAYPCSQHEALHNVKTLIRKAHDQILDDDDDGKLVQDKEIKLTFELDLKYL
jgi:hypothetical protein